MPAQSRSVQHDRKGTLIAPARFFISRRQALLGTLAGLLTAGIARSLLAETTAPTAQELAAAKPRVMTFFTPSGAGKKDGSNWRNAMPVSLLSKAMNSASPGSGFLIGFNGTSETVPLDRGQILVRASGDENEPVFVQAGLISDDSKLTDASPDAPAFFKSERPWSVKNFKGGSSLFAFENAASHLRISGFHIDGTGPDGFFKFRAKEATTYDDVVISGIEARNVGRVIETERGAMLQKLTVTDCRAVGIVRGFARFRELSNSTLRNMDLDAAHMDAGGKDVCQLIAVSAGENLLFENITLRNAINQPPPPKQGKKPGYVQGDGIVCELGTRNVTIRNCHANGMGDGGFDLKTTNVTLEDCTTESCKFGARIWVAGDNMIRRCSFRNPVSRNETEGACIQAGGTLQIVDTKLHAGAGTAAINLSQKKDRAAPMVVMHGGSIETEGDGTVVHANAGGVLELHDVIVNGVPTTHRYVFEKKENAG